jgi:predicted aldo/keto reductase-like oxidoreductase
MKMVRLGKTGLQVSRVGMGGIPIQRPPLDEAIRVIRRALDLGINFIDTAHGYGASEERIGKGIAGRREQVIIATKGGGDRAGTLACIEMSLARLNTDHIDLWQFHGVNDFEAYQQILGPGGGMEGAQAALRAGKIRHIGFSSHSLEVALKAVASGHFETVQFPLNFVSDEAAEKLVPLANECDLGFIAMKPFAGGNIRNANLAFRYLLQFDSVVADPGIEKTAEIEEIVSLAEEESRPLSAQERLQMESIRAELGSRFCHQCGYCMPCAQAVNIPMVMITQLMWREWPPALFRDPEWWFVKAVQTGQNCIECGECETKCPYRLPIREMIVENLGFFDSVRTPA